MRMFLVVGTLALAACGASEESTTIAGTTYSTANDGQSATIDGPKGKLTTSEGAAAANTQMPDFAPKYPGSTITSSMQSEQDGRAALTVLMTSGDAPADIAVFYRGNLERAGFDVEKGMRTDNAEMFSATKEKQKVSITTSRENGPANIVVSISGT